MCGGDQKGLKLSCSSPARNDDVKSVSDTSLRETKTRQRGVGEQGVMAMRQGL